MGQEYFDSKVQDNGIDYKVLKELKYDIYKAISQNWETVFSDEFFYEDSFSLEQSYFDKNQLVVNFKPRKEAYFKWEYDFEKFKAGLKTIPDLKLKSIHKKSVSVRFDTTRFTQVDQIVFQYTGQITGSIREDSKMQGNEIIDYKGIKIGVLHTGVGKLYEVRYNKNKADWPEYYKLENAKKYIDILLTKGEQAANASWKTAEGENRSYQPDILLDDILSWFEDHEQAKEDLIVYLKNNRYTDEDIKDLFGIVEESLNESSKANYTIEYYLNTATADRRPSTKEDVEEDYIYDTIQASNDLEALEEAFFIQTGEDYYEEIFDDYRVEDTVEGLKNYFDSRDIGDGSIIICKITQGSRVIYDSTLNKQYFLDEVDEDEEEDEEEWGDIEEDLDQYLDEYDEEVDEGEAVFVKENGTPGYLVKDGGKTKFLRNYTERQVKDLGFKIKKNSTENILKEGFYEGGFPNFESFMVVVYEGETYGDYDVEFPHFSKTIDLIDSIWEEKYSDKDTWDQIPFTTEEKDKIFKVAQEEAEMWDNIDLYNSHARYNYASIKQIKAAIRDAFNVTNKYLHENLKEDYTPTPLEDEIIRIVGDDYENGYSLYKNIEMLKDDFINSFDYDFSKVDFNSLWALYNKLHDMGPKSFYDKYGNTNRIIESFKDSAEYEYNGIQIFAVPLNDGLISVTGQWKKDGGKFGKAQPDEKIYRTTNKNLAIKTYIDKYLKNFLDKNLKDIDKNPDAYWD